jgi:dienelactone hydrolase
LASSLIRDQIALRQKSIALRALIESGGKMRKLLICASLLAALGTTAWRELAFSQERASAPKGNSIEREKLVLSGWDPDEPVPAYAYYKQGSKAMPVVIFLHGLGGSKEQEGQRLRDLAERGFFVLAIDAYLHGERKVPGIFPQGKSLGNLGEDYSIWVHQSAVSHTARDVSKIIDALSARSDVDTSRVGVVGISMGSSTCMVLACKEPRISVVVGLIGAVDFWYDVTKTPPGPEQDAKRSALSPRVRQLVDSLNPRDRMISIAPKALFLANGARDKGIDIRSVK